MYRTLADEVANARTPNSRGFRLPSDDPPRLPGAAIGEGSYIAAARIRAVLQESPTTMTPAELARRLGIERCALAPMLVGVTFACASLYETDRGRLGLTDRHETDD